MKIFFSFLFLALLILPVASLADRASSTNFLLDSGVIDVGGGRATSTGFNLRGSLGQPGVGVSTSTSFILIGGFLGYPGPAAAVVVTPSGVGPSVVSVPGGGGGGTGYFKPPYPLPPTATFRSVDLNHDGRVDIIDLSILLYFYGKSGPSISAYDFDDSGTVDFVDVSIMMYYWTG